MIFLLYERRTATELISNKIGMNEEDCIFCGGRNTVEQLKCLRPNTHNLKDDHDYLMMEQQVFCKKCGRDWIDVFCRVYPPTLDLPDTQSDRYSIDLNGISNE